MNPQIINHEIQIEPLATRVAFHPVLAGMNHTQLALLTDCAVARHFNANQTILREGEFANGFYLIETGKVALESVAGFGESIPLQIVGAGTGENAHADAVSSARQARGAEAGQAALHIDCPRNRSANT